MYEIIYDVDDETRNIREIFHGGWFDLQDYVQSLRDDGCFNIAANWVGDPE